MVEHIKPTTKRIKTKTKTNMPVSSRWQAAAAAHLPSWADGFDRVLQQQQQQQQQQQEQQLDDGTNTISFADDGRALAMSLVGAVADDAIALCVKSGHGADIDVGTLRTSVHAILPAKLAERANAHATAAVRCFEGGQEGQEECTKEKEDQQAAAHAVATTDAVPRQRGIFAWPEHKAASD